MAASPWPWNSRITFRMPQPSAREISSGWRQSRYGGGRVPRFWLAANQRSIRGAKGMISGSWPLMTPSIRVR